MTPDKHTETIDTILSAARAWALENVERRYTGTMVVEIVFHNGGVSVQSVRETRTLVLRGGKKG